MILGASILQIPAIIKAKEMGLKVVAVDMNPEAVGFQVPDIEKEIISTIDIEKVLEAAKVHKIDGIMTLASDMPMRTVAVVAQTLGLPGIDKQTALNTTNKAVMRKCLETNHVPIPEYYKICSLEEYWKIIENFKFKGKKCIVKPADNSGSRGVNLISDFSNNQELNNVYKYSKQFSRGGEILVEEYMEGKEVSVETISINGICHILQITDKLTTGAPYFVEMGHSEPSMLEESMQEKIKEIACKAVKAVGIESGPSHTEIIVTNEGPKIVELGARMGGDNITTHLVPLSTGIDMVKSCILLAIGEYPDISRKCDKGAAIRYLNTKQGRLTNIYNVETAKKIEGIKQISIVRHVGEEITKIKSSVDRMGFVIAQAKNAKDAISICEDAMRIIEIEVN